MLDPRMLLTSSRAVRVRDVAGFYAPEDVV